MSDAMARKGRMKSNECVSATGFVKMRVRILTSCKNRVKSSYKQKGGGKHSAGFYTMYVRKKHNRSLEAVLCFNVCIHVACAFDAAAGAANGLKAQRAWVRETGILTLHGEQTDLSLCPSFALSLQQLARSAIGVAHNDRAALFAVD